MELGKEKNLISIRTLVHASSAQKLPSERSFGILFTIVSALGAGYSYYRHLPTLLTASFAIAALLILTITFTVPDFLRPLNRAWFTLGLVLGKIVSPIVLGAMFFLVITPVAIVTRIFGRDELRLRKRSTNSYWVRREPPGPQPESFKRQF